MHSDAESHSLLAGRGCPCADYITMRTEGCRIPWVVLRIPGIEVAMMIGQRNEDSCACLLVACDQLVGVPIEQGPLRAEFFVSEARCRPVIIEVILVLPLPLDVNVASVPVTCLGDTLRRPVRPEPELGIAVPVWSLVIEQGI